MKSSVDRSRTSEIEDSDYPGIQSYGISVTTLEEVFLRVASCNLDIEDKQEDTFVSPDTDAALVSIGSTQKSTMQPKLLASCNEGAGVIVTSISNGCRLIVAAVWTFIGFISMQCCACSVISRSMFWRHCKALLLREQDLLAETAKQWRSSSSSQQFSCFLAFFFFNSSHILIRKP